MDGHIVVTGEYSCISAGSVTLEIDCRQAVAGIERKVPDVGDAGAYRDVGQAGAVLERLEPDVGDAIADLNAGQAFAVSNAASPMLVTLLGIVTLARLVQ